MKNLIYIFLVIFCHFGCETKCDKKEISKTVKVPETIIAKTPISNNPTLINSLIDSALFQGNERAYNRVASYYLLESRGQEFFYYAFTMANKYNSAEASYHVYDIIAYSTPEDPKEALMKMDNGTKNFALFYLLKSYEAGFESAKYAVHEIFGKDSIPKSSFYLREFVNYSLHAPENPTRKKR